MQGGRHSQVWGFRCRAYRTKLIASRPLQCAPTSGQPGILYLLTIVMCWVHWLLLISILLWSSFCFYWPQLFEWPSNQWVQPKELEYLVARTVILHWSQQRLMNRDEGVPGCPLLFSEVVTYIYKMLHIFNIYNGVAPYQTIYKMLIGYSNFAKLGVLLYVCLMLIV